MTFDHNPLTLWQSFKLCFEIGAGWATIITSKDIFIGIKNAVEREIAIKRSMKVWAVDRKYAARLHDSGKQISL